MPLPVRTYLGIDPGENGGLALLSRGEVKVYSMPETKREMWDWFLKLGWKTITDGWVWEGIVACVEKVGGYIGGGPQCPICHQPRNKSPGSSMFLFGEGYGALLMALTAAGIPYQEVPPQTWQKSLGIPPRKKGESKTHFKGRLKTLAERMYPDTWITLATSDALLIATYCKRLHEEKETP